MGGKDDDDAPQEADLRMDWIGEKVCATLKIKMDKFKDMDEVNPKPFLRRSCLTFGSTGVAIPPQGFLR